MSIDTQIVYPKLGEILAQVGSIMSMLMTIQYVLRYYNEQLLDCDFIDKVLGFYFQDYSELKKSKEKVDFRTCKELIEQAKKKLVYTNVIYELSRIQLFLLHHFGRNQLFQAHQYAICAKEEIKSSKCCLAFDNFIIDIMNITMILFLELMVIENNMNNILKRMILICYKQNKQI